MGHMALKGLCLRCSGGSHWASRALSSDLTQKIRATHVSTKARAAVGRIVSSQNISEVLAPGIHELDLIWKKGLCRCNEGIN